MLSSKLVRMIEQHWDPITDSVIAQIRRDPKLEHVSKLPSSDLREIGQSILQNLSRCLFDEKDKVVHHFEDLGRRRFHEDIPLCEAVHGLNVVKEKMIDYARGQGLAETTVDVFAEEELEHQVGLFFDELTFYFIRGYEQALRQAARMTAIAR
jgi:hypothetical protein